MDQVQGWLSAGGNGRERDGTEDGEGETAGEGDEVLKGVVDRLCKGKRGSTEQDTGKAASHLDQEIDVPGLDVPERDE